MCSARPQSLTRGLGEFCGGVSQELAKLLEKAPRLSLGGGSTAVVVQDPSRMMELSTCALSSWALLVPCYPPTIMDFLLLIPRWSFCLLFPRMERVGWSWRFLEVAQVWNLWYERRPQVF